MQSQRRLGTTLRSLTGTISGQASAQERDDGSRGDALRSRQHMLAGLPAARDGGATSVPAGLDIVGLPA